MKTLKNPAFNIFYEGFRAKAFYGKGKNRQYAWIEIRRSGKYYKSFKYPAYKIWNIAAHFPDIVMEEKEK